MSGSVGESNHFTSGEEDPRASIDIIGLKEALSVLVEVGADEESVLSVIEQVLMEPLPDFRDEQEVIEFREKMRVVKNAAESQLARAELIEEIQSRIQAKIMMAAKSD